AVEVYPTRPTAWARVDVPHIREWERRYGACVRRVHLEFLCDEAELRYVLRRARHKPLGRRLILWAMYSLLQHASSGRGTRLASELGVTVNVHTNVLAHWLH